MKEPTFKVGDIVTFLGHNDLPDGDYLYGGANRKSEIAKISEINEYFSEYDCYEITTSDDWRMLECEFEEYLSRNSFPKEWYTENTPEIREALLEFYKDETYIKEEFENYKNCFEVYNYLGQSGNNDFKILAHSKGYFSHEKYLTNQEVLNLLGKSISNNDWTKLPEKWYTDYNSEIKKILLQTYKDHPGIEDSILDIENYEGTRYCNFIGFGFNDYLELHTEISFRDNGCKYYTNDQIKELLNIGNSKVQSEEIPNKSNNLINGYSEIQIDDKSTIKNLALNITANKPNKFTKFFNY